LAELLGDAAALGIEADHEPVMFCRKQQRDFALVAQLMKCAPFTADSEKIGPLLPMMRPG